MNKRLSAIGHLCASCRNVRKGQNGNQKLAGTGDFGRGGAMNQSALEVTIREFRAGDEEAFRKLNEAWITRYFTLESKDEVTFADPQKSILASGGRNFLAVRQGDVVGCCALIARGPSEFEVAKMAVDESYQRAGIGRQLLEKVITEARVSGVARLYLETNQKLLAAIRLYQSLGFRHLSAERVVPSLYARADVYMELYL